MEGKSTPQKAPQDAAFRLTPRWVLGIAIAVACLVFVFSNTGEVSLRFLWIELSAPAWMFLFLLLGAGFLSGWLVARSRYR